MLRASAPSAAQFPPHHSRRQQEVKVGGRSWYPHEDGFAVPGVPLAVTFTPAIRVPVPPLAHPNPAALDAVAIRLPGPQSAPRTARGRLGWTDRSLAGVPVPKPAAVVGCAEARGVVPTRTTGDRAEPGHALDYSSGVTQRTSWGVATEGAMTPVKHAGALPPCPESTLPSPLPDRILFPSHDKSGAVEIDRDQAVNHRPHLLVLCPLPCPLPRCLKVPISA